MNHDQQFRKKANIKCQTSLLKFLVDPSYTIYVQIADFPKGWSIPARIDVNAALTFSYNYYSMFPIDFRLRNGA